MLIDLILIILYDEQFGIHRWHYRTEVTESILHDLRREFHTIPISDLHYGEWSEDDLPWIQHIIILMVPTEVIEYLRTSTFGKTVPDQLIQCWRRYIFNHLRRHGIAVLEHSGCVQQGHAVSFRYRFRPHRCRLY